MRTLAVIPARANSKGLPGKNIRDFRGKPLLEWAIEAARACHIIDQICVSSDGEDILQCAKNAGAVAIERPAELATDSALPKDAVLHALDTFAQDFGERFDIVVLLQPTSPLRQASDIEACIAKVKESGFDSAATFCPMSPHPDRAWQIIAGEAKPFKESQANWAPRQAMAPAYAVNGAVYAVRTAPFRQSETPAFLFGRSAAIIMPSERSFDIDTLFDLQLAELAYDLLMATP